MERTFQQELLFISEFKQFLKLIGFYYFEMQIFVTIIEICLRLD